MKHMAALDRDYPDGDNSSPLFITVPNTLREPTTAAKPLEGIDRRY